MFNAWVSSLRRLAHAAFGTVTELDSVIQAVRHTYVLRRRPADKPNHRLRDAKMGRLSCVSDSVPVGLCVDSGQSCSVTVGDGLGKDAATPVDR